MTRLVRELPTGGVVSRDRGYRTDFLVGSAVHSLTATRNISRHECSKKKEQKDFLFFDDYDLDKSKVVQIMRFRKISHC